MQGRNEGRPVTNRPQALNQSPDPLLLFWLSFQPGKFSAAVLYRLNNNYILRSLCLAMRYYVVISLDGTATMYERYIWPVSCALLEIKFGFLYFIV
jgi:hypothetical protein